MKKSILRGLSALLLLSACNKAADNIINKKLALPASGQSLDYLIPQGQHECNQSTFKPIATDELKFTVRFDSSAVYQTRLPEDQYDINKLYGFSDNNADHHQYSARFGWCWSNGALRLFGYIYNNGVRSDKELGIVTIGVETVCSIKVTSTAYIFTLNGKQTSMPRLSTTPKAQGYLLYPYFGGEETAPHTIDIRIKNL